MCYILIELHYTTAHLWVLLGLKSKLINNDIMNVIYNYNTLLWQMLTLI